jgi:AcrR family transcriptional regulator
MSPRAVASAIVEATLGLLADGERLTYDALARRAGVSRQTLYTHFPTRAELLVATADHARTAAGADAATQEIYDARTAVDALRALVAFHVAFVPRVLPAYIAVERERSVDPEVDAAFRARSAGRHRVARLVATRLAAEHALAPPWTVDTATDLIHALTTGTSTALFMHDAGWKAEELRDRLTVTLERTLLNHTNREDP